MMLDIKAGKLPSVRSISGIVDEMINQVLRIRIPVSDSARLALIATGCISIL